MHKIINLADFVGVAPHIARDGFRAPRVEYWRASAAWRSIEGWQVSQWVRQWAVAASLLELLAHSELARSYWGCTQQRQSGVVRASVLGLSEELVVREQAVALVRV